MSNMPKESLLPAIIIKDKSLSNGSLKNFAPLPPKFLVLDHSFLNEQNLFLSII